MMRVQQGVVLVLLCAMGLALAQHPPITDITISSVSQSTVYLTQELNLYLNSSKGSLMFRNNLPYPVDVYVNYAETPTWSNVMPNTETSYQSILTQNLYAEFQFSNGSQAYQPCGPTSTKFVGLFTSVGIPGPQVVIDQPMYETAVITDGIDTLMGRCQIMNGPPFYAQCYLTNITATFAAGTVCSLTYNIANHDDERALVAAIQYSQSVTIGSYYSDAVNANPDDNSWMWDGTSIAFQGVFYPPSQNYTYACSLTFISYDSSQTLLYTTNTSFELPQNYSAFSCMIPDNTYSIVHNETRIYIEVFQMDPFGNTVTVPVGANKFFSFNYHAKPQPRPPPIVSTTTGELAHHLSKTEYIVIGVVCGVVSMGVTAGLITYVVVYRKIHKKHHHAEYAPINTKQQQHY